jgi:hypothetical protein
MRSASNVPLLGDPASLIRLPGEGRGQVLNKAGTHRDGEDYVAHSTAMMRRLEHDVWRVLQRQQSMLRS